MTYNLAVSRAPVTSTLGIAMSPIWFALWFGLALLVVYQTFVTLCVVQSATFSEHQSFWQFMFGWLLSLVGVTIAHWFVTAGSSEPLVPHGKFIS